MGKALQAGITYLSQFNCNREADLGNVLDTLNTISSKPIDVLKQPVIILNNISLKIPIYCQENRKFTKLLTSKMLDSVIGGELTPRNKTTKIEALKKINLTIMNGERVALIGHNGSGKTSFLRLISGIYTPTHGELKKYVEVYPMLQKTFLTSSELNGIDASKAYYLMIKNDLKGFDDFLEDIVNFSGLGSFINLPIKTYSDGMCARLIFSMLTSYQHECLAIDEGFGTGDADFFERAQKRLQSFMDSSTTLILASHSESLLKQFCIRGIVFNQGSVVYDGSLDAALNYYHTHDYYHKNVI
jgi:lipopolysaccharide transport system ATP-binding protein